MGSSLTLCAFTTAIGFYVFVPTAFRGFSELGLIAGTGMFVILGLTLTLFPALLSAGLRLDPADLRLWGAERYSDAWDRGWSGHVLPFQ